MISFVPVISGLFRDQITVFTSFSCERVHSVLIKDPPVFLPHYPLVANCIGKTQFIQDLSQVNIRAKCVLAQVGSLLKYLVDH